jgi:excinuclease ABC subunit A
MAEHKFVKVRGARKHNLKGVDDSIPRDQLVVITGLSGSGKSSLAFDTIYAEGQRPQARQLRYLLSRLSGSIDGKRLPSCQPYALEKQPQGPGC